MERLRTVLLAESRIAYAILFGSEARGDAHAASDLDIAIELEAGATIAPLELGMLIANLERACERTVDVVLLESAPPGLAYRIFRDGTVLVENDHRAFALRKARAILEYLDFQPSEALLAQGVLAAAARGR